MDGWMGHTVCFKYLYTMGDESFVVGIYSVGMGRDCGCACERFDLSVKTWAAYSVHCSLS